MKDYDVNFNNKTILLEGEWFNIKELGEKIKYNINKGNYKIKHLSAALESLQDILESAKDINVSVLGTTFSKLEIISKKYNKNIEILVRDAIDRYISSTEEGNPETKNEVKVETKVKAKSKASSISESNIIIDTGNKELLKSEKKEEESIEVDIDDSSKPPVAEKSKPQIIKAEKIPKSKPNVIESKINSDKEIKKQPSIIVNKSDDDDWFKQ